MRFTSLIIAVVLLAACDRFAQPESMLDEYNERLARVLDVEQAPSRLPPAPRLPQARERSRHVEPISISMIDFLGLYGCDVQFVVGERNSILGRVAHPLTRLDVERRFILAAETCAETLERESLVEQLVDAAAQKRQTLPEVAWNAVWANREIEHHFARSRGPLPVQPDLHQASLSARNAEQVYGLIGRLLDGDLEQNVLALDPVYQRWNNDPMAGQALMSAILVTTRLNDATRLIEQRLGERPLCPAGRPTSQSEILHNVFIAVFVGHIQPYLADVQRVRRQLMPPLLAMSQLHDTPPGETLASYFSNVLDDQSENGYWRAFDEAISDHTQAWQALLEQCDLAPARDPSASAR